MQEVKKNLKKKVFCLSYSWESPPLRSGSPSASMFSLLDAAAAAAPPAQPAAAAPAAHAAKSGGGGGMGGMGALGGMMSGKGGFTGGTAKDKQMNSIMNWFTNEMNSVFGGMAPKKA